MGKTKVKSSSSKQFVHPGGNVHVTHPASAAPVRGKGLGKPGGGVGKQTSKAARPA